MRDQINSSEPPVINLNEVMTGVALDVQRDFCQSTITLDFRVDHGLGFVRAYPNQVREVIVELVKNAVEAMQSGGTLTIAAERKKVSTGRVLSHGILIQGTYVSVSVTDTGCGMAENVKRHLFQPFFTTKANRSGPGGLALIFGIAAANNWQIDVQSQAGHGTQIVVFLPSVPTCSSRSQ